MNSSTLLLFKLFRIRIAAGMGAAFCIMLWRGYQVSGTGAIITISAVSLIITLVMRLDAIIGDMMFPVTNRQVAWIPIGVWFLVSLSGIIGTSFSLCIGYILSLSFGQIKDYWLSSAVVLPLAAFWTLLLWRVIKINFVWCWIFVNLPLGISTNHRLWAVFPARFTEIIVDIWPLWILGCIYLVYEAPHLTAVLRRSGGGLQFSFSQQKMRETQLQGPTKPDTVTLLANALCGITGAAIVILYLYLQLGEISYNNPVSHPHQAWYQHYWMPIILSVSLIFVINHLWWQNRASGMSQKQALKVLLLELTLFGYAFRDRLGVARGQREVCRYCNRWRMVWMSECPHCGDGRRHQTSTAAVAAFAFPEKKISRVAQVRQTDRLATIYRDLVPVMLFINVLIFRFDWILRLFRGK